MNKYIVVFIFFISCQYVLADTRFKSTYPCRDAGKVCVDKGGTRNVDGFDVYKDCWEWQYIKTCDYPSKNDCRLYEHCYLVADRDCLFRDLFFSSQSHLKREVLPCSKFFQE